MVEAERMAFCLPLKVFQSVEERSPALVLEAIEIFKVCTPPVEEKPKPNVPAVEEVAKD